MENKWYILNVMAGQEQKIANKINNLLVSSALKQYIDEVLVPTKKTTKIKNGKKAQVEEKLFPGYVFVKGNLDSDAYNILNRMENVMNILGTKNKPKPVSEKKMVEIQKAISNEEENNIKQIFEIGEKVNVIEGPFESFTGTVENFDTEKQKAKISILIFGRSTSVELDISQIEKIS